MPNIQNNEYNTVPNIESPEQNENDSVEGERGDEEPSPKIPRIAPEEFQTETGPQEFSELAGYGSTLNLSADFINQHSNPGTDEDGTCSNNEHDDETRGELPQNAEEGSLQDEPLECNNGSSTLAASAPIARVPDFANDIQNEFTPSHSLLSSESPKALIDFSSIDEMIKELYGQGYSDGNDIRTIMENQIPPNSLTIDSSTAAPNLDSVQQNHSSIEQTQLSTEPEITNHDSSQASISGGNNQNHVDVAQPVQHVNDAGNVQSPSISTVTRVAVAASSIICCVCRKRIAEAKYNCIYERLDTVLTQGQIFEKMETVVGGELKVITSCGKFLFDALFDDDEIAGCNLMKRKMKHQAQNTTVKKLDDRKCSILAKFLAWMLSKPMVADRTIENFKEFVNASRDIKLSQMNYNHLRNNVLIKYRSVRSQEVLDTRRRAVEHEDVGINNE